MKIIETEEFFKTFEESGMTFNQWLEKFEKPEAKEKTKTFLKESEFIQEQCRAQLEELKYKQYLLVIAADWCGDCQRNLPIIELISRASDFLNLRILKKEDHLDLLLKSNGGEKIPYVMFYSQDGYFISNWIERSYKAYKFISDISKNFNYEKNETFFKAYAESFEKEKNKIIHSTSDEIVQMILKVNAIQGASTRLNKK